MVPMTAPIFRLEYVALMFAPRFDYAARSTWTNLSDTELASTWTKYVATRMLGDNCPKVGIDFFFYPSLGRKLRGAVAKAPIARGEKLCEMPVQSMLSEFSVGNSTLRPVMDAADAEPAESTSKTGGKPGRKKLKSKALDRRAHIALFVLRETSRVRSPHMPYLSILLSHDVTGVPMTWPPNSKRSPSWLQKSLAASPHLRSLAAGSRANAVRAYDGLVPLALSQFAPLLSEGLDCQRSPTATCSPSELQRVYSRDNFIRVFAILAARDWVLPMYGKNRAFCVPIVDMFNFGQVCAWHPLRRLASSLALSLPACFSRCLLSHTFLLHAMCTGRHPRNL